MEGWAEAYLKRLTELKVQHVNHIVGGSVADYEEYRHLRGTIHGLSIAEREFKEVVSEVGEA
tara:strand:+ start:41 stop:226 length:186 start_codon:yes stop_codon:yes gene_type:complete